MHTMQASLTPKLMLPHQCRITNPAMMEQVIASARVRHTTLVHHHPGDIHRSPAHAVAPPPVLRYDASIGPDTERNQQMTYHNVSGLGPEITEAELRRAGEAVLVAYFKDWLMRAGALHPDL